MGSNYLLTVGALALLSLLILTTMNVVKDNYVDLTESEVVITGISLGQSLIDEIKTKAFDEQELAGSIDSPSDLSTTLGPDSGENVSDPDTSSTQAYSSLTVFDDIDDYNGYVRSVDTDIAEGFLLTCTVTYASISDPDVDSGSKTYCKRVTVTITSPFFDALPSVQLNSAITY